MSPNDIKSGSGSRASEVGTRSGLGADRKSTSSSLASTTGAGYGSDSNRISIASSQYSGSSSNAHIATKSSMHSAMEVSVPGRQSWNRDSKGSSSNLANSDLSAKESTSPSPPSTWVLNVDAAKAREIEATMAAGQRSQDKRRVAKELKRQEAREAEATDLSRPISPKTGPRAVSRDSSPTPDESKT